MAFPERKRNPSFSSSVLDSIYRSIDESDGLRCDLKGSVNGSNENVSSSASSSSSSPPQNRKDDKLTTLRREIMDDEHWLYARSSTPTTNSSDSSVFSSSEGESYRAKRRSRKLAEQGENTSGEERQRTKRTSVLKNDRFFSKSDNDKKLKAMKMLDELKRSKQPVSPGARLTSFLNSIFQSNAKKVKLCSVGKTTDVKSSSSRSCFSRTKHKTDNNNNNCKNFEWPVRFYPVRVSIDGDCRDYGHKNVKKSNPEFTTKKSGESVTSLKEEIKTKVQSELTCITRKIRLKDFVRSYRCEEREEEEEEDACSHSSSDLFELDPHQVGMGAYVKELPVYETTDFKTNQAIATGLVL